MLALADLDIKSPTVLEASLMGSLVFIRSATGSHFAPLYFDLTLFKAAFKLTMRSFPRELERAQATPLSVQAARGLPVREAVGDHLLR